MVRQLEGYGRALLPKSPFETETDRGTVVIAVDFSTVILTLQRNESQKEKRIVLPWDGIRSFSASDDGQTFQFSFAKDEETVIEMKVFSAFAEYFADVFEQVKVEHEQLEHPSTSP
ncbi:sorting nexin [Aphelenchoides avenae]|nr:sorting nexin [Aphelenchus avenae]